MVLRLRERIPRHSIGREARKDFLPHLHVDRGDRRRGGEERVLPQWLSQVAKQIARLLWLTPRPTSSRAHGSEHRAVGPDAIPNFCGQDRSQEVEAGIGKGCLNLRSHPNWLGGNGNGP